MEQKNSQQRPDKLAKFKDPKYTAKTGLVCAGISFLIFGKGLSMIAVIMGVFGIFFGVKQKAGWKIISLNVLAIILGFVSRVLLEVVLKS